MAATKTTHFKLEDSIPAPPKWKTGDRYPLREMEVGQSFALPTENIQSVREAVSTFQRRNAGYTFTVRKFEGGYRCWRIA